MKALELLDERSARAIGFDWLERSVAPVSPFGARLFSDFRPFRAGDEGAAQARAEHIAMLAERLDAEQIEAARVTLGELPDVSGAIARAAMGEALDDPDFFELRQFAERVERVDALVSGTPGVRQLANDSTITVRDALAPAGRSAPEFYLSDAFDAALAAARATLAQAQAEFDAVRGRERDGVARALGREEIAGDEFIVMRDDLRGPLPPGVHVVRQAPTYLLCALESGEESLAALGRCDAAADRVATSEEEVRARLSSLVGALAATLNAAARGAGELDVMLAAARFAKRYECAAPAVIEKPALSFERGRFLPLEEELASQGRRFTPLDLELEAPAVLTGPNMGGKSVALQTCGFLALCCAFGLPLPAARARVGLFDRIAWLGAGREERTGGLLSSFAQELVELKTILESPAPRLLLLVDEFARTTTPQEGKALQVALLARLRERKACGMLATHLAGIAPAAEVRHFAVCGLRGIPVPPATPDLREALEALATAMDYSIAEVTGDRTPQTDAISLAALLGLDRAFVDAAYRALTR